jgi:hypothetical protein
MFARILCFRDRPRPETVESAEDQEVELVAMVIEEEEDEIDDDYVVKDPDKSVMEREETNEREAKMMAPSKGVTAQAKMESPFAVTGGVDLSPE